MLTRRQLPAVLLAATPALADTYPSHDPAWAKEVVGASHYDLGKVKAIVDLHPAAANAAIDWGFGDWETALGAASHIGRREIAEYLLEKGARLDIFAATMLGMTDVVKALVAARPGIEASLGPHGIPLLAHARSADTRAYLQTLPGAAKGLPVEPLDDERRKLFTGKFRLDNGLNAEVKLSSPKQLSFVVDKATPRFIHYTGNDVFYPAGVPTVRIEFSLEAKTVRIVDGPLVVNAKRLE
jgi:hypothetical protein